MVTTGLGDVQDSEIQRMLHPIDGCSVAVAKFQVNRVLPRQERSVDVDRCGVPSSWKGSRGLTKRNLASDVLQGRGVSGMTPIWEMSDPAIRAQ